MQQTQWNNIHKQSTWKSMNVWRSPTNKNNLKDFVFIDFWWILALINQVCTYKSHEQYDFKQLYFVWQRFWIMIAAQPMLIRWNGTEWYSQRMYKFRTLIHSLTASLTCSHKLWWDDIVNSKLMMRILLKSIVVYSISNVLHKNVSNNSH